MAYKIISLETINENTDPDSAMGWRMDETDYQEFVIDYNDKITIIQNLPVKDYNDYEHFVGVMGKFMPYTRFLKDPIPLDPFDFIGVISLY